MNVLKIDGYNLPSENVTKMDIKYSKVYGDTETTESGHTYTEQVRNKVPAISVQLTNVTGSVADAVVDATSDAHFSVQYLRGTMQTCDMKLSGDVSTTLVAIIDGVEYYTVTFDLEGV